MNSAAFRRIVWKEFRAQCSLWVALVFGALLLQAMIVTSSHGSSSVLFAVATTGFVLTACFAVASLALLFAGETEEGTRDWLRQLPIQPVVLVGAKLTFSVVAIALFFAATWCTGLLATGLLGKSAADLFKIDVSGIRFPSILGVAAWGLLFSLRRRRVMVVLFCAVVAEVVMVSAIRILTDAAPASFFDGPLAADRAEFATYFAVVAVVLVFDVLLALRWARAGGSVATVQAATRKRRKLSLSRGGRREGVWLRVVAWAARRGSPAARETAVLVWRELRGLAQFAAIWLPIGLLVAHVLTVIASSEPSLRMQPFQLLYLVATPAVCGLLTCLGDQRQQMFRFLGERGASPVRVWWIKQSVWLVAAFVLTLACVRWDVRIADTAARARSVDASLLQQAVAEVHIPGSGVLAGRRVEADSADWALRWWFAGSLLVSLFAAGQCASQWIRRPILAFGAMVVAVPLLVGWHFLLVEMDVALWLGSWPLTLALLAATLCSAGAWLRGRDSWMLRFTHLAAVALPVIAVLAGAAAHRAFSVPTPVFPKDVASAIRAREATFDQYDVKWSNRCRQVLSPFVFKVSHAHLGTIPPAQFGELQQSLINLAEEIPGSHGRLDPLFYSPDSALAVSRIGGFLADPSLGEEAVSVDAPTESVDEQWQRYEAGLRIAAYLSQECQSSEQYQDCLRARGPLLRAIQDWAARADQTPESLQRAFDVLVEGVQQPLMAREMALNRYVFYERLLEQRGRKWAEIERDIQKNGGFNTQNPMLVGALMPGFERERLLRLLGHATAEFLSPSTSPTAPSRARQLVRWAATSGGLTVNIAAELRLGVYSGEPGHPYTLEGAFEHLRALESGTALVVALQRHRLAEGVFPASLSDVVPSELASLLRDPYTNAPFGYEPGGFPADVYLDHGRVIAAGQPLLWTSGHNRGWITRLPAAMEISKTNGSALTIPAGAYVTPTAASVSVHSLTVEPTEPDRIKFITAGSAGW